MSQTTPPGSNPTPPLPSPFVPPAPFLSPKFDQVVEGNVDIKRLNKNKYQITVSDITKFLLYQVWSSSSKTLNEERSVYYEAAKKWVNKFNSLNASLKASNKPLFTPTTVMEIGDNKYVFVLNKAKFIKGHEGHKDYKDHVVFTISTKGFEFSNGASKKLLKLPLGKSDGVRFDIDPTPNNNMLTVTLNGQNPNNTPSYIMIYNAESYSQIGFSEDSWSSNGVDVAYFQNVTSLNFSQIFFEFDVTYFFTNSNNMVWFKMAVKDAVSIITKFQADFPNYIIQQIGSVGSGAPATWGYLAVNDL